jgi:hypothetical protein
VVLDDDDGELMKVKKRKWICVTRIQKVLLSVSVSHVDSLDAVLLLKGLMNNAHIMTTQLYRIRLLASLEVHGLLLFYFMVDNV